MFPRLRSFWRGIWRRSAFERDLDQEMRFHVETRTEQLAQSGLSRQEAERRARVEFGSTENYQEMCRESRGMRWLDDLAQDLRYGARTLRKSPGLMLVTVLTLAVGVGGTSLLFSMVRQWVIQAVSFPDPDKLAVVWKVDSKKGWMSGASARDFQDWQEQNQAFETLSAWTPEEFNVTGGDRPERIHGARVSANFFRTLGVLPIAGRDFVEGEDRPGAPRSALISYGLWRERFQSKLLDQAIHLNGEAYTVAGVLPEDFHFALMGRANIWVPLVFTEKERSDRANGWLSVIGRRKQAVAASAVEPEMNGVARDLERQYPETNTNSAVLVRTLSEEIGRHVGNHALYTGFVMTICIALIACSNLAGIFLARALTRRREMSVRLALGARRSRLARQLLSENALLMPAAIAAGLWMARLAGDWISRAIPYESRGYLPNYGRINMHSTTIAYAVGVAAVSVLLFSISPVLEGCRLNLTKALKESGSTSPSSARSQRLRQLLVICQVVLAMMVIVPAGLTAKSLWRLLRQNPGFRMDHLLTAEMALPVAEYAKTAQRRAFYDHLLERLRALPHVESAAASETIPFGHRENWVPFWIAGKPEPTPGDVPGTLLTAATPGYASTLGLSLLRGRFLSEQDGPHSLPVVVISQTLAQRYFANEDALGRKLRLGRQDPNWYTIVGIVRDVKINNLDDNPMSQSYTAYAQSPAPSMTVVLRTTGEPAALAPALQSAVQSLDKELPLSEIAPLEQRIADQQAPLRILTQCSSIFAVLAVFLASIGIYGVMAYLVESRTREIGIRIACGAERQRIFWLVLSGALRLMLIGLSAGLLGAWSIARLLMNALHGVSPNDLDVYATAVAVLCGAVLIASCVPVRHATQVDPLTVLRCE
jgi:putative ABC transport system permease protein